MPAPYYQIGWQFNKPLAWCQQHIVKSRLLPHCVRPLEQAAKPIINFMSLPTVVTCYPPDSCSFVSPKRLHVTRAPAFSVAGSCVCVCVVVKKENNAWWLSSQGVQDSVSGTKPFKKKKDFLCNNIKSWNWQKQKNQVHKLPDCTNERVPPSDSRVHSRHQQLHIADNAAATLVNEENDNTFKFYTI